MNNNTGKGFLIGFLAGGALGAVLALLYAPKSGKELRDDIRSKTDEYLTDADRLLSEGKEKASEFINEGKKRAERLVSDAKVRADELLKDAEKVFSDAKTKAGDKLSSSVDNLEKESSRIKTAFKSGVDAYKESKNS